MINNLKISDIDEYKELPIRIRWAIDDLVNGGKEIKQEKEILNKQIEFLTNFTPRQELKNYPARFKVWDKDNMKGQP